MVHTTLTKRCFKCGEQKPLDAFYAHPDTADGRLGKCVVCAKADVAQNYAAKRERYSAYDQRRTATEARRMQKSQAQRTYRLRWPGKIAARRAVRSALRRGDLVRQPCSVCGAAKTQAHHTDYSKPLDVEWLCFRCHREHGHNQKVPVT
jgi:hypothetical protein